MKKSVYTLLQWTWGLPQTLLGSAVYIANRKKRHFDYEGACVTVWDREDGMSLGKFIFVPKMAEDEKTGNLIVSKELAEHEYGHTIQSLMLGPAYLILVGIPSFAWNRLPYFDRKRKKTGKSYYSAVFERTASEFGSKAAKKGGKRKKEAGKR
jgi:hypothetical protein